MKNKSDWQRTDDPMVLIIQTHAALQKFELIFRLNVAGNVTLGA